MQCPKCRASMPNGAKYCTECGAKLPEQSDSVPNVPQFDFTQTQPASAAAPVMTEAPSHGAQGPRLAPQNAPVKLKWYKFLICFALWVSGVLSILNSVTYFTGTVLGVGEELDLVYAYFPMLKVLMIFCGVVCIAYGIFAIYTRYQLAEFRRSGPTCLYALYAAQIAFLLFVQIAVNLIFDEWTVDFDTVLNLVLGGLFLAINVVYFRKRRHLFCN